MEEKTQVLTLLEQGMSVICMATDLKVTRMAIYTFMKGAAAALPGTLGSIRKALGFFSLRQHHSGRALLSFHASEACQSLMTTSLAPQGLPAEIRCRVGK